MARKFKIGEGCKVNIANLPKVDQCQFVRLQKDIYVRIVNYTSGDNFPYEAYMDNVKDSWVFEAKELDKLTDLEKELYG